MLQSQGVERDIPVAAGWPVVGSSVALLRDPLAFLRREYARLGPVFDVRAARRRFTVLAGPEANRFIAVEGRDCFASRSFWGELAATQQCPHLILAVDGPEHKRLRGIYRDDLSRAIVAEQSDGIVELTLRELIRAASPTGVFRVRELTRVLVSRQVHYLLTRGGPPIDGDTVRALLQLFRWDTNTLLLGKWPRVALRAPAYRRYARIASRFLDELIASTEHTLPDGWFGTTHRARREHPALFTEGDTRMAFLLPFIAGVDTVGSTLAFLLYEVLRDPALLRRVTADVDACYERASGRPPSVAALRAVPSLHGLVLESLRLHPAAFALYRETTRAFAFAGARIPAGRGVVVFTSSPHTDPRYFPDPYRFDVDRFAPPRSEHKQRYVFAPYGGGPHVCLGAGMGEALLLVTAAALLRHAELASLHPERRYGVVYDPSLAISDRYRVRYLGARQPVPCDDVTSHS